MKNIEEENPMDVPYKCPFDGQMLYYEDCYDRFLIAGRLVKDENAVKEKDRDALYEMCLKCQKYK